MATAQAEATKLFKALFPLELIVTGVILLFRARDSGEVVSNFTMKILAASCFLYLISIAPTIFNGLPVFFAGEAAKITHSPVCQGGVSTCGALSPGTIVAHGFTLAGQVNGAFKDQLDAATAANQGGGPMGFLAGLFNGLTLLLPMLVLLLSDVVIVVAYLAMAGTLAVAEVEAQILGSVGALVLGFAAFRYTNSYSEKFISLAFSVGAKLFMIFVMLGVTNAMMLNAANHITMGGGATTMINPIAMLKIPLMALFATILVFKIPQLASSFSSGTTGMNLGAVISSSLALAGAAMAATGVAAAGAAKAAGAAGAKAGAASLSQKTAAGAAMPSTTPAASGAGADMGSSAGASGSSAAGSQAGGGSGAGGGAQPPSMAGQEAKSKPTPPPFKPSDGPLQQVKASEVGSVPKFDPPGGESGAGSGSGADAQEDDREPVSAGAGSSGGSQSGGASGGGGGASSTGASSGGGGPSGGGASGGGAEGGGMSGGDGKRLAAAMERIASYIEAGGGGGGGGVSPQALSKAVASGLEQSRLADKIGNKVGSAINPRRFRDPGANGLTQLSYRLEDIASTVGDRKNLNLVETLALGTSMAGQQGSTSGHHTGASV